MMVAAYQFYERGFPRTVGSHQDNGFTGKEVQVNTTKNIVATERLVDSSQFANVLAHGFGVLNPGSSELTIPLKYTFVK